MIKKRHKKMKSFFFCEGEAGEDIFYPWGYPGKGFFIDENKKKTITKFLYVICSMLVIVFVATNFASRYEIIKLHEKIILIDLAWVIFPLWYFFGIHSLTKNLSPKIEPTKAKPKIFYILLFLLFIQVLSIVGAIYAYPNSPFFMGGVIFVHFIYFTVIAYFALKSFRKVTNVSG